MDAVQGVLHVDPGAGREPDLRAMADGVTGEDLLGMAEIVA